MPAKVAVKLLNISLIGRAGGERFKREGSILARLAHPHIARLFDAGVTGAGSRSSSSSTSKANASTATATTRFSTSRRGSRLFLDVLAAVAHCPCPPHRPSRHQAGQHPGRADGRVKLLDFGIAKLLEESAPTGEATELNARRRARLTPEYAAPEQLLGEPVTIATDVYALGVLLYVLLGGQHPAGAISRSPAELDEDDRRRAGAAAVRCGRLDADAAAADARRERGLSLGDARQAAAACCAATSTTSSPRP